MEHGGKRRNSGQKGKPEAYNPSVGEYDALLTDLTADQFLLIKENLWNLANGIRLARWGRKAGRRQDGETEELLETCENVCKRCKQPIQGEEMEPLYVYTQPPNLRALNVIIEHQIGKPGQKQAERLAPVIVLKHCIPGIADVEYQTSESPAAEPPPADSLNFEYLAALGPDHEDSEDKTEEGEEHPG